MNGIVSSRTFSVPVRYVDRRAKPLRQTFGTMDVALRSIAAAQAPLVARWWPHVRTQGGELERNATSIDYRTFEGRLWAPFRAQWYRSTGLTDLMVDPKDDDPERWSSVLREEQGWPRAYDHPLLGVSGRRSSAAGSVFDHDFHAGASDSPGYAVVAEGIATKAARLLLIDDELWAPSIGPGLRHGYSRGRGEGRSLEFEHQCTALDQGHFWTWKNLTSALVAEDSIRTVAASHGRDFPLVGEAPEIVGDMPIEAIAEVSDRATEAQAWHALWMHRRQPFGEMPRDTVDCLTEIRRLLAERWPHKTLDWDPKVSTRIFDHWEDEDIPDARALVAPLERLLVVSSFDTVEKKEASVVAETCRSAPRRGEAPELDDLKL